MSSNELRRRLELLQREDSPVTTNDVERLISNERHSTTGGNTMTILSAIAASLVAGVIGYYGVSTSHETRVTDTPSYSVKDPEQVAIPEPNGSDSATLVLHSNIHSHAHDITYDAAILPSISVMLDSIPGINPAVIETLRTALADIDSVRYCGSAGEHSRQLCIWSNGGYRSVTLGDSTSIKPVLFTTINGRGFTALPSGELDVDLNQLIPLRTDAGNGSMVLWIRPNEAHIASLPDALKQRIQNIDRGIVTNFTTVRSDTMPDENTLNELVRSRVAETLRSMGIDTTFQMPTMKSMSTPDGRMQVKVARIAMVDTVNNFSSKPVRWVRVSQMDDPNLLRYTSKSGVLSLDNVHPNPITNSTATLAFTLTASRHVSLDIVDITGKHVLKIQSMTKRHAGRHEVVLNTSTIPAGLYIAYVRTDEGEIATQRVVIQ